MTKPEATHAVTRTSWPKRLGWAVLAFVLILVSGAAAAWFWRVPVAEAVIGYTLKQKGVANADIQITNFNLTGAEIARLQIGGVALSDILIAAEIPTLLRADGPEQRRVGIRIGKAEITALLDDTGTLTIPGISELLAASSEPTDVQPGATALPVTFTRLQLDDLQAQLQTPNLTIPIDAAFSLKPGAQQSYTASLALSAKLAEPQAFFALNVQASLDAQGLWPRSQNLQMTGKAAELRSLAAALFGDDLLGAQIERASGAELQLSLSGWPQVTGEAKVSLDQLDLASPTGLRLSDVETPLIVTQGPNDCDGAFSCLAVAIAGKGARTRVNLPPSLAQRFEVDPDEPLRLKLSGSSAFLPILPLQTQQLRLVPGSVVLQGNGVQLSVASRTPIQPLGDQPQTVELQIGDGFLVMLPGHPKWTSDPQQGLTLELRDRTDPLIRQVFPDPASETRISLGTETVSLLIDRLALQHAQIVLQPDIEADFPAVGRSSLEGEINARVDAAGNLQLHGENRLNFGITESSATNKGAGTSQRINAKWQLGFSAETGAWAARLDDLTASLQEPFAVHHMQAACPSIKGQLAQLDILSCSFDVEGLSAAVGTDFSIQQDELSGEVKKEAGPDSPIELQATLGSVSVKPTALARPLVLEPGSLKASFRPGHGSSLALPCIEVAGGNRVNLAPFGGALSANKRCLFSDLEVSHDLRTGRGRLGLGALSLTYRDRDISGDLQSGPLSVAFEQHQDGKLSAELAETDFSVELEAPAAVNLEGRLSAALAGDTLKPRFGGSLKTTLPGASVALPTANVTASASLNPRQPVASLQVTAQGSAAAYRAAMDWRGKGNGSRPPRITVREAAIMLGQDALTPAMLGLQIDGLEQVAGRIMASGPIVLNDPLSAALRIKLEDGATRIGPLSLSGLGADLYLRQLKPLLAPGPQKVSLRRASAGVPLTNFDATFSLPRADRISIADASVNVLGGTLSLAEPVTTSLTPDRPAFTLKAERLSLVDLLKLADLRGLEGTGELSGLLPLKRDEGGALHLTGGRLATDGPGILRYRPDQGTGSALKAGQAGILLDVLEDFRYQSIALIVDGQTGGKQTARLEIKGANPNYQGGHPVALNVNVEGALDSLVTRTLELLDIPGLLRENLTQSPD